MTGRLVAAGCVAAAEEAAELIAAAPDPETLDGWLTRREVGEPLAWIVGSAAFCGRRLRVAPGVYVPRPQTEDLARRAAEALRASGRAIDLCCGAGAIAAHLMAAVPTATVVGVDIDVAAARCARSNGVSVVVADLGDAFRNELGVDIVTAVAPYVPTSGIRFLPADVQRYEPVRALDGGTDGLDLVRRVIATASRVLRPGGRLFIEIGGGQAEQVQGDLVSNGLAFAECWCDEDDDIRGLTATMR